MLYVLLDFESAHSHYNYQSLAYCYYSKSTRGLYTSVLSVYSQRSTALLYDLFLIDMSMSIKQKPVCAHSKLIQHENNVQPTYQQSQNPHRVVGNLKKRRVSN